MKRINKYIGAALLGFATLAIPSCSDTWDDHYNGIDEGTSANKTLWELICERPELSRFKQIAEKSTYYRDETRPQENYTFKDMLNGSMLITAWVPENDAFTEAEFNECIVYLVDVCTANFLAVKICLAAFVSPEKFISCTFVNHAYKQFLL